MFYPATRCFLQQLLLRSISVVLCLVDGSPPVLDDCVPDAACGVEKNAEHIDKMWLYATQYKKPSRVATTPCTAGKEGRLGRGCELL